MLVQVICVLILGTAGVRGVGGGDKSGIFESLQPFTDGPNEFLEKAVPQKRDSEYYLGSSPYSHDEYNAKPKKTQPSPGFHYDNSNPYKYEPYTDGYQKSWKTLRTEKFETETVDNPHSSNPDNKYIVKSTYKIREKLPFEDHTIGYDQNYEYPISDIDRQYDQNEKIVDYNSAKTDPFSHGDYQIPKVKQQQKKKPKEYHYEYEYPKQKVSKDYDYNFDYPSKEPKKSNYDYEFPKQQAKKPKELNYYYKYPSDDYEYHKNVHLVDFYINKNNPAEAGALHEEPKPYGFNDVDYGVSKAEKYSDEGPSHDDHFHKYKTDGPSYDYL